MINSLDDAIRRHRHSGFLVDSNLLTLFLVGYFDVSLVPVFKRTRAYSENDYELLSFILLECDRLVVTPSVLAEVSNLCAHLDSARRADFFKFVSRLLPSELFTERLVSLDGVARATGFVRLGFTDATIEQLSALGVPVLTDDLALYVHLNELNREAFNFTHLRSLM
jgi:hypothetical protein